MFYAKSYTTDFGKVFYYLPLSVFGNGLTIDDIKERTPPQILFEYLEAANNEIPFCAVAGVTPRKLVLTFDDLYEVTYEFPVHFGNIDLVSLEDYPEVRSFVLIPERINDARMKTIIRYGL